MKTINLLCFLSILTLFIGAQTLALSVTLHNKSDRDIYFKYRTCWQASTIETAARRHGETGFEVLDCPSLLNPEFDKTILHCNVCKTGDKILLEKGKSYTIYHPNSWVNNLSFYDANKNPDSTIKFYGNDGKPMPDQLESWFNNYEYTLR